MRVKDSRFCCRARLGKVKERFNLREVQIDMCVVEEEVAGGGIASGISFISQFCTHKVLVTR